jgi:hypothetical protein
MAVPLPQLDSFQAIPSVDFNTSGLTSSFQPMNGTGFPSAIKMLKIYNGSGVGIDISYDGVNKHDFWPSGATLVFDFQTNHSDNPPYGSGTLYGRAGQIIYGRTTSTSTYLNISAYF